MIDTHAHLDQPEFDADRDSVLRRAREAGVAAMLCVGITAESSQAAIRLAEQHTDVYAAVGIQPNYAVQAAADDWQRVVQFARLARVVAIGETGLDRYWDFAPFALQQDYFDRHLRLAQECGLPVIIHCREADADLLPMLRDAVSRGPLRGVLHAFGGASATAAECLALGLHVSFAGNVTYTNKKFESLRQVAATIPDDRLLVETDCPYMTPHPLRGKEKRNEPAWIAYTVATLAKLRGVSPEQLADQTTRNARELFKLPG